MPHPLTIRYPRRRAFITGAGSGLGKALCLELAREGWTIGIVDINFTALMQTATEIKQSGGTAIPFELNVGDKSQYATVAEDFLSQTGGIDLLFNNAGVGDGGLVGEYSLDNWEWLLGINLLGVIYGCHYFVPVMKRQGYGHIINTASAASFAAGPGMAAYNVSKAGVLALSETMYGELLTSGVQVSVVMPWFFQTNIAQYARGSEEVKQMAQHMVQTAKLTAPEVAQYVLHHVGRNRLHILPTPEAKFMWWFKRLSPIRMIKYVANMTQKKNAGVLGTVNS